MLPVECICHQVFFFKLIVNIKTESLQLRCPFFLFRGLNRLDYKFFQTLMICEYIEMSAYQILTPFFERFGDGEQLVDVERGQLQAPTHFPIEQGKGVGILGEEYCSNGDDRRVGLECDWKRKV